MTHPTPAHIHPKLVPFVYRTTRINRIPITNTETRTVPGAVTVLGDAMGGFTVNQQFHTEHRQVNAGIVENYYAVFEGPDGSEMTFRAASAHPCRPGTVLYLGIEPEYYVYQYENMPAPRMIVEQPPGGRFTQWLPGNERGTDLQSPKGQMDMRAASYPLRDYLKRIGKGTPRTLIASTRLSDLMASVKAKIGTSYNYPIWPRRKEDLPADASFMERLLWPIMKYRPVKTHERFAIAQKVSGEVNKAWLGGGLVLGTLGNYLVSGTLLVDILRTLHLNQWFYMGTFTGVLIRWLFFVFCALALLSRFMKPAIKKPFKFDEDAFFKVIDTTYHPRTRLGFCYDKSFTDYSGKNTDLMSDAELADYDLLWAHQEVSFMYDSYADLVRQLDETKLTPQERQTLLDEIAATTPAY
jgi:hypothetical protein